MKPINNTYIILILFFVILILFPMVHDVENWGYNRSCFKVGKSVLESGTFHYDFNYEGFLNMPIVSLLFVPFALFDIERSGDMFVIFEIMTYVIALWCFLHFFTESSRDQWMVFFLFLCSKSFYTCVREGQLTILCLLAIILMIRVVPQ